MTWQRQNCKESFAKGAKKDMLSWHWINCLLLGLSLVEKFVCYCVKCYLYAYPSVRLLDSLPFLSLTLYLSLFFSFSVAVSALATRRIVYHFRSGNSHVMFGVHFICPSQWWLQSKTESKSVTTECVDQIVSGKKKMALNEVLVLCIGFMSLICAFNERCVTVKI